MSELPKWPNLADYTEQTPYGPAKTVAAMADYELARAEAAIARLKLLIDACADEGGHKPTADHSCFICKALAHIGPIPE